MGRRDDASALTSDTPPTPVPGRVAVVGVCASGKSVLVQRLQQAGYDARHVAQEHSYVADMWQRLTRPEVLVYLDASLDAVRCRRDPTFPAAWLAEQQRRLAHARKHAQVCIVTDELTEEEVFERVADRLRALGIRPAEDAEDAHEL